MSDPRTDHENKSPYRWTPWIIAAAMLLVVAVNGGLIYLALSTRSAQVGASPYKEGNQLAKVLAQRDAQAGQHWQVSAGYLGNAGNGRVVVELRDAAGQPIDGAKVWVRLTRPVGGEQSQSLELAPLGQGRYQANYAVQQAGQWDLAVEVSGAGIGFASEQRIVVR